MGPAFPQLVPAAKERRCDAKFGENQNSKRHRLDIWCKSEGENKEAVQSDGDVYLKVLRNAGVSLLWEDGGVLDSCVSPRRHVPNDRLLTSAIRVVVTIWTALVVALVVVVFVVVVQANTWVLA